MKISHTFLNNKTSFNLEKKDLEHPNSLQTMTCIESKQEDITIITSVLPAGNHDKEWLTISVCINNSRHMIFNDELSKAPEFFKRFPRT